MKAISIPATGKPSVVDIEGTYEDLSTAVGGYIEGLNLTGGAVLYLNEEGKPIGLPTNQNTELLAKMDLGIAPHDFIVGNAIVVGVDDEGETIDVPQGIIDTLGL